VSLDRGVNVLYIGGTGTISASCVAESVRQGMDVSVINRGRTAARRPLPPDVTQITADVEDGDSMREALTGREFDCVVNFLSYGADDAAASVERFRGRTGQYIHISTAAMYHKPVRRPPFVESTTRHNPFSQYAKDKIAAENVLLRAYDDEQFPVTIVRPSHTYDDAHPPLPGDWTVIDRIVRGDEIVVPGDGTSLWTLTHATDFAVGLVGLIGNWQAVGESFHITSDDVLTWNGIYESIGHAAGRAARLVHVPSEFLPLAAPDWFWSGLIVGDLQHSVVLDNTKIRRYVPSFAPKITWSTGVRRLLAWRADHATQTQPDARTDAIIDRLVGGYHEAAKAFEALAP
jgi:nucleoside-diphosphate-sugar epimerase